MDTEQYETNPRNYVLTMVEEGELDPVSMLTCCLKFMGHDDVKKMLDINGLSPRFDEPQQDDEPEIYTKEEIEAYERFNEACADIEPEGFYDESTNPSNGWRYPGDE